MEGNKVEKLDNEFFLAFQHLKWLDIRYNMLLEIPKTVANHPCLEVLLLEGNKIKQLPIELGEKLILTFSIWYKNLLRSYTGYLLV